MKSFFAFCDTFLKEVCLIVKRTLNMETYDKKEIASLIVKYLQGELSEEEIQRLEVWRKESVRHEADFQKYLSTDFYATMKTLYTPGEEDKLYMKLRKKLIQRRVKRYRGGVIWSSAAILLLLFAWGAMRYISSYESSEEAWQPEECIEQIEPGSQRAVLYLADGQKQNLPPSARKIRVNGLPKLVVTDGMELVFPEAQPEDEPVEGMNRIEVPRGGEYQLILSDKTRIYLNSESELQFPSVFRTQLREVAFRGEAYFKVARTGDCQPFVINTAMGKVEVLGTAFNLRCYDASGILQLTLEEGSVRFTTPDSKQSKELHSGEQLVYSVRKDSLSLRSVPTCLYTSWKDGVYSLEQTPLGQIMEDLSRWYDVPIVYESEDLKYITFTGEIKRYKNFREVMQIFELTKRIRFRMKGNNIHILRE